MRRPAKMDGRDSLRMMFQKMKGFEAPWTRNQSILACLTERAP